MSLPYEEIDYACCECGCMAEHLWGLRPPTYPLCLDCAIAEMEQEQELARQIEEHEANGGRLFSPFVSGQKLPF